MQGVTEVAAGVPEGMALSGRAAAYDARRKFTANIDSLTKRRDELAKSNDPDKDSQIAGLNKQIDFAQRGLVRINEDLAQPLEESGGFTTSSAIRSGVESVVGTPDPRDQSFSGKLAGGFGSLLAFIGTTVVAAKSGGKGVATGVGAAVGSTSTAAGFYKEARQLGADEETAVRASQFGALIGSAEIVPIMTGLKYLPPALKVKVTNALLKKAMEIGESGVEEGIQEYLSQVGTNLTMIGQNIDPNRPVTQGAAESALLGAILGTGTGAIGAATSGEPKVQTVPERGPDAAQEEALKTDRETPSAPPPAEATPTETTATATVTPAETPEPDKSGVTVGETAPDITAAVTATSNEAPADEGPQRPAQGAPPAAVIDYIKQKAAFLEAQRAKQAQATTNTGAPSVPPDTAQAPEGPQVGGAPAAPTTPAGPAPSAAAEALQGLDAAGAPAAPTETAPITPAPSPAAQASEGLPPVEPPAEVTSEVTTEVTPPIEEAPAEPPKERKYTVLSKPSLLAAAGFTNSEISTMSKGGMARATSLIRSRVEADTGEQLEYLDPTERKAAIAKAWEEIKQDQAQAAADKAAKGEAARAEAEAAVAAAPKAPKAQAAVETSKARGGRKSKAQVDAETAAAEAARKEEERKARVEAGFAKIKAEREAEAAAEAERTAAQEKPAPRVLKPVDDESIRKEAEVKVATEDRDAAISEENAKADAVAAAAAAAPVDEKADVRNNSGKAERVRRVSNKRTADDIIARDEHNTNPREEKFEGSTPVAATARTAIVNRARRMVDAAKKLMAPDSEGKVVPSRLYISADEDLAPNAATMLLHEAQRLAGKENPTLDDIRDFRVNEFLLRNDMVKDYIANRKIEGDIKSKPQPTATNKDGETTDAVDRAKAPGMDPEESLAERQNKEDPQTFASDAPEKIQDRQKFTSESNPGYSVGGKKEGTVKLEIKPKRRSIKPDQVRGDTGNIGLQRPVKNHVKVTTIAQAMDRLDPGTIKLMGDKVTQRIIGIVLGRIRDAVPDLPVVIITQAEMDAVTGDSNTGGFYNPNSTKYGPNGAIFVSEKYAPNGRVRAHLIAHEGLHALFSKAIESDPKLKDRITELADYVRESVVDLMGESEAERHYGLTIDPKTGRVDPHEFISEALSEPEFQEILRDMELTDAEFSKFSIKIDPALKTDSSVWNALKGMVRQYVLKMSNTFFSGQRGYTVLDAVMQTADTLDVIGSEMRGADGEQANLPADVAEVYFSKSKDDYAGKLIGFGIKPSKVKSVAAIVRKNFPNGISDEDLALLAQSFANEPASPWTRLIAGNVPRKLAIEINNFLKAEVGKTIDPATVDVLIEEAIEEFGKKDTSGSNGGGVIPPYSAPASPGMGPGQPAQKPGGRFKGRFDGAVNIALRRFGLKTMTLDFMRQKYRKYFDSPDGNFMEKWIKAIQTRDKIVADFAAPIEKLGAEFQELSPKEQVEFASLALEATTLNVRLGGASNSHLGKNAAKGLQAKKKVDALNARFENNLSDKGKDLYKRLTTQFRESHNNTTRAVVYNILSELRRQQEASFARDGAMVSINTDAVMGMMERVVTGKLTEDDAATINDKTVFNALKRATALRLIEGDYFPLMRFGENVVTTREIVQNPGWTSVERKLTSPDTTKTLPNGKVVTTKGKTRTVSFNVKTEVVDTKADASTKPDNVVPNAVRVIFNPDERGARIAVMRHLKSFAEDNELTLQGISTKYRDRKTGKVVSKGQQMVDREYDMMYEARFQTEGAHFFESVGSAREFIDSSTGWKTSQPLARRNVDMGGQLSAGQLGSIVEMVKAGTKYSDKKTDSGADAAHRQQMVNLLETAVISQMAGNRAQKNFLKRRNVRGASKDLARSIFTYASAAGNYYGTLNTAPAMRDAVVNMQKVASDPYTDNSAMLSELMNEVYARDESITNPNRQTRFTSDISTISYADKLISPGYSLVNGLQTIGTSWPILAGRHGAVKTAQLLEDAYTKMGFTQVLSAGVKNTGTAIKQGTKDVLVKVDSLADVRKNLGKEYEALMDDLEERNAVGDDTGLEIGSVIQQGRGRWGRLLHKVDRAARQMPNAIEMVNRVSTAVAAYDGAISDGKSKQEAIEIARTTVIDTQGDYRASNTPRWMKMKGTGWAFQFKKYPLIHMQLIAGMVGRSINADSQVERMVARRQLMYYAGTTATLAGVMGLPIATEIMKTGFVLAGMALGGDGWEEEEYQYRKNVEWLLGETLGSVVNNGLLSTVTGIDYSSKLSLSSLLTGREPYKYDRANIALYALNFVGGAPGGMLLDWLTGTGELLNANTSDARVKALSKLIPIKMGADIAAAYRNYQSGDVGIAGAIANAAGFKTLEQSEKTRDEQHNRRMKAKAKRTESQLFGDMMSALDRGDTKDEAKIRKLIENYNAEKRKENPRAQRLNPAGIVRYWRREQEKRKSANGS